MAHPARIGRYTVLGILGQGAMGIVYRGRDDTLDREVALKVMGAGRGADADNVARFKREAKAVARLQHPNIITIYELGEHDGAPFMAMELLIGMDLHQAIEAGIRPDPKITLPIILHVLAGLGHAHDNGIVHRDVKPSNIFLPRGRPAKVMDFGVARLAGSMTSVGAAVGTPNYMSPEQVNGASVDGRSDLFSVGLILHELVTGEKAFYADSVVSILYKIAHEEPDMGLLPQGPTWARLRGVLVRSLAKSPEARYLDARAMAADLLQALLDLGGSPDAATPSDRSLLRSGVPRTPQPMSRPAEVGPPPAPPVQRPAPAIAPPAPRTPLPPPSRRGLVWGLGGALAALAAGGIAFFAMLQSTSRPTPSPSPSTVPSAAPSVISKPTGPSPRASSSPLPATPAPVKSPLGPLTSPAPTPGTGGEEPAPSLQNARLDRANQLFEKGRYQAALNEARAVLAREPGNSEARALLEDAEVAIVVETRLKAAQAALKRGDREGALAEVRSGLAANPSDARLTALFRELTQ